MSFTQKVIGTHNGRFHCDEALAVYMLRMTSAFRGASLVRTRDPEILASCDVVVDVGGVYDASKSRFDHHQRGFYETFTAKHETKLSSAGLVYKHFGKEIIAARLQWNDDDPNVDLLYNKIYTDFIEALDGGDNGISQYPPDITPKYRDSTNLPSRVGKLNPWWNQTNDDIDARFNKATELAGSELVGCIDYLGLSWIPAREIVSRAMEKRYEVDGYGQILLLEKSCPWKEHLLNLEEELKLEKVVIYVVFPDENSNWRVQAVPKSPDSFETRKALPEAWRGFRDSELSERSGIPKCIFVHISGFIGGNGTRDGALEMARKALN